jgi:hypothetical protein
MVKSFGDISTILFGYGVSAVSGVEGSQLLYDSITNPDSIGTYALAEASFGLLLLVYTPIGAWMTTKLVREPSKKQAKSIETQ